MAEWFEAWVDVWVNRFSIPATGRYCLATLMSSDRTKQICLRMTIYIYIYIYPASADEQYATLVQFFKRSLPGFNSEFCFSKTGCHPKIKNYSLPYYLSIAGGKISGFIPFSRLLALSEKCIWSRLGFELVSPCPFSTMTSVEKRKISYFVLARYLIQHWISPNQDDLSYSARTFISG